MQKVYTDDVLTSGKTTKKPKQDVLNNLLAFSKQLEVVKSNKKTVELNLN